MKICYDKYPYIKLKNGINVCNFSSPHQYIFHTGEVLNACSDHVANTMKLKDEHTGIAHVIINGGEENIAVPQTSYDKWKEYILAGWPQYSDAVMWLDVSINYKIPDQMLDDILMINEMDVVDIILVPYPVLDAWKRETNMHKLVVAESDILNENDTIIKFADNWELALNKMRTCHLQDRVSKVIYTDRFCK